MKAWRFTSVEEGLVLTDIPAPEPGDGQVLIDVHAAGVCHTDVGTVTGELVPPVLPTTMGHEIFGTVAASGPGVTGWTPGQRVAVAATPAWGGYAEQVVADASLVVAVPDGVDEAAAAVATDAGLTAYHAVHAQGGVEAGMKVGIIGFGGLGAVGARLAVLAGAEVYVAEPREQLHDAARGAGAVAAAPAISDFADENLDLIIDFAGFDTTRDAFSAVRPGGRVVQVGIGRREATIDLLDVLAKQIEYRGSVVGTADDLQAYLDILAEGKITPVIERIGFDDIAAGIDRLGRGEVEGRLVAVF